MYLNYINYFRGIAILFIVAGHCFLGFGNTIILRNDSLVVKVLLNLILGGSTLFVCISGFLFHYVYLRKFKFDQFIIKKIKFVLTPFIVLTTLGILFNICICLFSNNVTSSDKIPCVKQLPYINYYLGIEEIFIGYWYIPFILIMFLASPIFEKFIKLNLSKQFTITLILFIVSTILHRGSLIQNVIFFTPVYMFGMILSQNLEKVLNVFKSKEIFLLLLVISLAFLQAYLGKIGSYNKNPFEYGGIDLMIIQKMILSIFFIICLKRFENHKFGVLKIIADYSFGIYFIHGFVIILLDILKTRINISLNAYYVYFPYFIVILTISIMITYVVKKLFVKNSRYLIGS